MHLEKLLRAMAPFDDVEAGHRDRMFELIAAAGDPFARSHFVPGHFTASSFILAPDGEALLLIFHGKLHRWLQPGGHIDPEDTDVFAAARREVVEETGITQMALATEGVFDVDIHPIPAMKGEPAHEHFDVRFLFQAADARCEAASDAKQVRWFGFDEITPANSDASVMRALEKLRRRADRGC
jgi:8-oxo-dGTP pyrophosphatase MutT (NUDIX family)